jgi:hypothetical protein
MRLIPTVTEVAAACALALIAIEPCYALDSYRYLHVTIETPWMIFLFLLVAVLSPFILMAVLVWRFSERRIEPAKSRTSSEQPEK